MLAALAYRAYLRARGGTELEQSDSSLQRAYLRARGGTASMIAVDGRCAGLSPRTRRNPSRVERRTDRSGLSPRTRRNHVDACHCARIGRRGLSPRTRRNPRTDGQAVSTGPISAHAEEPQCQLAQLRNARPISAHAEEPSLPALDRRLAGLSPRTRRNPAPQSRRAVAQGPISAHAEEPLPHNPLFPQRNPLFPSKLSKSARPRLTRHDAA